MQEIHHHMDESPGVFAPHEQNEVVTGVSLRAGAPTAEAHDITRTHEHDDAQTAFRNHLERIGRHIPEVGEEYDCIVRGGNELIETFKIRPDFFAEPRRSTILTSLALAAGKTQEAIESGRWPERENERRQSFIAYATLLLTRGFADGFPDLVREHEAQLRQGRGEHTKALFDRFEQPELTRALTDYINREKVLDDLLAKLGDEGNAMPEYHVLSIGVAPSVYFETDANEISWQEARTWGEGVEARTRQLAELVPEGELIAGSSGFAIVFMDTPGRHHVYIPMPDAEVLMAEERGIVPSEYMIKTQRAERVRGTVKHEAVHTRDPLIIATDFGRSLEERRAEHYSGNASEYFEVKSFFQNILILHGSFIGNMFDEALASRHSQDPVDIYELVGKYFGLEAVAEVAASQPHAYTQNASSRFTRAMLESLGTFEDILLRSAKSRYVDQNRARERLVRSVNNLRASMAREDGSLDTDYEIFLGQYFAPVLDGLGVHLADIPFAATST